MRLPVIVAPMFLISGPDLVIAACSAGAIGSFPMANARTAEECGQWLTRIETALQQEAAERPDARIAPYAVNIIVRRPESEQFAAEISLLKRFQVPLVITSVGNPAPVVRHVHDYGGLVFHDVATLRHAQKAIEAGVDGLILLTAGAGGHTGVMNPFAFVSGVRTIWDGAIVLAGGMSDGRAVRAAEVLGADFAYLGTRFAATKESLATEACKALLVEQKAEDVIVTDRISGLTATFLRGSIKAVGLDPDNLPPTSGLFQPNLPNGLKAWRDIWSAGHGVGAIHDIPRVRDLVDRLADEYELTRERRL